MSSEPTPTPTRSPRSAAEAAGPFVAPPVDVALVAVTTVAVVVGIALRFAPRSGLWLDEALTVNIASLPIGDIGDALRRDGHPPLFYVMLHGWMALGGESDWWVRSLAGILSVLGLPLTYLAGSRLAARSGAGPLGSRRTGLLALAVMALLPYGVRYGAETRMYSLVITLVLAGYLLVDDLLAGRHRGARRLLEAGGTAIVAAALLWSHYWSMWLLAAVGLLALWRAWKSPTPEQRTGARLLVGALVLGGILFLPWVPALLYQSANTGTPWGQRFGPASVVVVSIVDFAGARHGAAQLLSYVLVPLVLMASTVRIVSQTTMPVRVEHGQTTRARRWDSLVIDSAFAPRIRNELLVMGLAMGVGWAAAFASNNTFASRYAAIVYPLFVLCVAAGLAVVRQPLVTTLLLAAVLTLSLFGDLAEIGFPRTQTEPIVEDIVADIAANDVERAVIIACPDQLGVALQRQVDQQLDNGTEVIPYPTAGDPHFVDWVDYGARNEASDPGEFVSGLGDRLPDDATVYLVTNTTYRTFGGKCERLSEVLAAERVGAPTSALQPDQFDETAGLVIFRPEQ